MRTKTYFYCSNFIKLRHCEKATKFEKNPPPVLTQQRQNMWEIISNFLGFSENLLKKSGTLIKFYSLQRLFSQFSSISFVHFSKCNSCQSVDYYIPAGASLLNGIFFAPKFAVNYCQQHFR